MYRYADQVSALSVALGLSSEVSTASPSIDQTVTSFVFRGTQTYSNCAVMRVVSLG